MIGATDTLLKKIVLSAMLSRLCTVIFGYGPAVLRGMGLRCRGVRACGAYGYSPDKIKSAPDGPHKTKNWRRMDPVKLKIGVGLTP